MEFPIGKKLLHFTVGPNHPSNVRQKRGFFGQSTITLFVFVLCVRDLAANSKRTSQSNWCVLQQFMLNCDVIIDDVIDN